MKPIFAIIVSALFVLSGLFGCVDDTLGLATDTGSQEMPNKIGGDAETPVAGDLDQVTDSVNAMPEPWAIAVVGTDYHSTSISIIDRQTQQLFREGIIDSGSTSSGLSVALSGDVVFPKRPNKRNWIVLLDRYPNSVLTFVDPQDFSVIGQLSVSTGFASNPHDFLWLSDHKAYVTRYESNPTPGKEDFDGGDDILIVDPLDQSITGRVALAKYADRDSNERLRARPDSMALAGDTVWITLDHLTTDFKQTGEGRVLAVEWQTDTVTQTVSMPEVSNCSGMVYSTQNEKLYLSCSGLFVDHESKQAEHSAIVEVDVAANPVTYKILLKASDSGGRPYGFDLELIQDRWLLAVRFGDLEKDDPDRLVAIDLETLEEKTVHAASSPYGLGGILKDETMDTMYVGEADPKSPSVHLYKIDSGNFEYKGQLNAHPRSGLSPRHIRFY